MNGFAQIQRGGLDWLTAIPIDANHSTSNDGALGNSGVE